MEVLKEIKATRIDEYELITTKGNKYIGNPISFDERKDDIITFEVYIMSPSGNLRAYAGEFKDDASVDSRLQEALKEIDKTVDDLKDYLKNYKENRKKQVEMVKKLRQDTDEGLLCCKQALMRSNWDFDKAKQYLKDHPNLYTINERKS